MNKARLSLVVVGLAALAGGLMVTRVEAALIYDVDFKINVTGGVYAGETYFGKLSYSDEYLTGSGFEVLVPGPLDSGSPFFAKAGLLSLSFDYGGDTFTMTDDITYDPGTYPWLRFMNGAILGLDYYGGDQLGDFVVGIFGSDLFAGPLANTQTIGSVSYAAPVARSTAVPEPTTLALLCLGGGLMLMLRRRRVGHEEMAPT